MYELGIIVDGFRIRIWEGTKFPEGKHDLMGSMVRVLRELYPTQSFEFYDEFNGKSYGY